MNACLFCKENLYLPQIPSYLYCRNCETYLRSAGDDQSLMVNERSNVPTKGDILTKSQVSRVLKFCDEGIASLVDFGCAGGKFLLAVRRNFKSVAGVEITPESICVAQASGLKIYSEIPKNGYQFITFWHSLEHLPHETLENVMGIIKNSEIEIVHISVPNSQSITLKLFGKLDTYFDLENHTTILSKKLLGKKLNEIGFSLISSKPIFSYTFFGCLQSAINFVTNSKNELYFVLKRGAPIQNIGITKHLFFAPIYIPLTIFLLIWSLISPSRNPVLSLTFTRMS